MTDEQRLHPLRERANGLGREGAPGLGEGELRAAVQAAHGGTSADEAEPPGEQASS